jgi:GntR family carbon starvation induced transcriptional regulator
VQPLAVVDHLDVVRDRATPLREAFARLAGEGWVSYLPQRGVRVAEVSITEVEELALRPSCRSGRCRRQVVNGSPTWSRAYAAYEDLHIEFHKTTLRHCARPGCCA